MKDEITIEIIKTYSKEALNAFNNLLSQLNNGIEERKQKIVREVLESPNVWVLVAKDKKGLISGMITLVICKVLSGKRATIEDVVVDKKYRGQGIGKKLVKKAIGVARKVSVDYVDLTSRPTRVEANNLYLSLGFKKRDTNVYRYLLKQ